MKALVLYDSTYGNTQSIADNIASSLQSVRAKAVSISDFTPRAITSGDLLKEAVIRAKTIMAALAQRASEAASQKGTQP